jgi:hypothetical protein
MAWCCGRCSPTAATCAQRALTSCHGICLANLLSRRTLNGSNPSRRVVALSKRCDGADAPRFDERSLPMTLASAPTHPNGLDRDQVAQLPEASGGPGSSHGRAAAAATTGHAIPLDRHPAPGLLPYCSFMGCNKSSGYLSQSAWTNGQAGIPGGRGHGGEGDGRTLPQPSPSVAQARARMALMSAATSRRLAVASAV